MAHALVGLRPSGNPGVTRDLLYAQAYAVISARAGGPQGRSRRDVDMKPGRMDQSGHNPFTRDVHGHPPSRCHRSQEALAWSENKSLAGASMISQSPQVISHGG